MKKIANNATGEHISFLKTPARGHEDSLEIVVHLPSRAVAPRFHYHPLQTKCFEAVSNNLIIDMKHKKVLLKPGERYLVERHVAHTCYPADSLGADFKIMYEPALSFEYKLIEMFAAANRRKSAKASFFDIAVILTEGAGEYYVEEYPAWVQDFAFSAFAWVGKNLGLARVRNRLQWAADR